LIPTLIEIGPFEIHSYGLMLALSFIVGTQLALHEAGRRRLPEARLASLCLWILGLAIVGSRLMYVLSHPESFAGRWLDAFRLWEGGLTMYGGFVAALVGALVYVRRHALPLGQVFDAFSPAIALGSGITRLGCFLNGCCFGKPCELPWAVTFHDHSFAGTAYPGVPLHPTQLYLSAAGFLNFALLWWLLRRRLSRPGQLFFIFLVVEALSRFSIDFLRHYDEGGESVTVLGLSLSLTQVVCLGLIVLAVAGLLVGARLGQRPSPAGAEE
jgi:phosphatidylglycerol:prolipoprotein diacylglycerol transferase